MRPPLSPVRPLPAARALLTSSVLSIALVLGLAGTASAADLGSEPPDFAYPNAPTFTAELGSHTVSGTLGPTPTDGQDPFDVAVPSDLELVSVSYSGPAGPHNLVGCGLTGTSDLDQAFTGQSNCTLSWFINTDFATTASSWTVTVVTQARTTSGDTTPPLVDMADLVTGTDPGAATAVVSWTLDATDEVGVVSTTCNPASGSTFALGETTVTCSATDAAGNVGGDTFFVTVVDSEAPVVQVPDDVEVGTDPGAATAVVTWAAGATDNVAVGSTTCAPASGSTFALGTTTVTCTAVDTSANVSGDTFDVTVVDDEAPIVTVPGDLQVPTDAAQATATVSFAATAIDNVDAAVAVTCDPAAGSAFAVGTTTVTCVATDAAGNVGDASFDVTVMGDGQAPVVTVPGDLTVTATTASGAVVDVDATATDDVDGAVAVTCEPAPGSTFAIGTTTVSCTATDSAGNVGTATFDVDVVVPTGPTGIEVLVDDVEAQGFTRGVERSLTGRLGQALGLLGDANPANDRAVCAKLASFDERVGELVMAGTLGAHQGDVYTDYVDALRTGLACP